MLSIGRREARALLEEGRAVIYAEGPLNLGQCVVAVQEVRNHGLVPRVLRLGSGGTFEVLARLDMGNTLIQRA